MEAKRTENEMGRVQGAAEPQSTSRTPAQNRPET
jgi:hypothetical protein